MTGAPRSILLVGGGLAAATCATTLRDLGYDGRLVLLSDEPHPPYERPPLSKGYLMGTEELGRAFVHDASWYRDHDVELRLGSPVRQLDIEGHTASTGADTWHYDRMLLATGSAPRRLPMADAVEAPVHYLRTIHDSDRLRRALVPGRSIALLGAGWIGLEVAAAAATAGCEVVVVEPAAHPLLRVLGAEVGGVFARLHCAHGVDLRTGVSPTSIAGTGNDRVALELSDGSTVTADALVVGIGATPDVALAAQAGLQVDDGVVVDEHLRSSHPDVFAAGDVANALHPGLGRHLRVEHWDNAIEQGRAAAANLLGAEQPYERLPYFFSDQYDLGMEYVGSASPDGYDEVVVRGDLQARVFTAFWVVGGRVVAGMQANDWDSTAHVRRIVEDGWSTGRAGAGRVDLERLRDPRVPLGDLP